MSNDTHPVPPLASGDTPAGASSLKSRFFNPAVRQKLLAFASLVLLIVFFSVASPNFLEVDNLVAILQATAVNGVLAVACTYVIITSGIDLSVGTLMTFCAVMAGVVLTKWGMPLPLGILAALFFGALSGSVSGFVITKMKVPPFIATLGMMTIARGLAYIYSNGRPVSTLTPEFLFIGGGALIGIPFPIIIFGIVILVTHLMLNNTRIGRQVYAIGGNETAARVSGVNVGRTKILIYTFSGLLAGLGGVVLTARVQSATPALGIGYELDAIAAAVIGGTSFAGGIGTVWGTVVGALIIGVMNNGLDLLNVSPFYQQVVKGVIIIVAIIIDERKNR